MLHNGALWGISKLCAQCQAVMSLTLAGENACITELGTAPLPSSELAVQCLFTHRWI